MGAELAILIRRPGIFQAGGRPEAALMVEKPDINPGRTYVQSRPANPCRHPPRVAPEDGGRAGDPQDLTHPARRYLALLDARPINYEYPKKNVPRFSSIRLQALPTFFDASMFSGREQLERSTTSSARRFSPA